MNWGVFVFILGFFVLLLKKVCKIFARVGSLLYLCINKSSEVFGIINQALFTIFYTTTMSVQKLELEAGKYNPQVTIIREVGGNYNQFWDEIRVPTNRKLQTVRGFWDNKKKTLTHSEGGDVILARGEWSRWSELVTLDNAIVWQKEFRSNGGGMGNTWTLYKA